MWPDDGLFRPKLVGRICDKKNINIDVSGAVHILFHSNMYTIVLKRINN